MDLVRVFGVISWILLPTVMYGGYALLGLTAKGGQLSPEQERNFRAGHAHAGVLLILSLVYFDYLSRSSLASSIVGLGGLLFLAGVLAQSGGFFVALVSSQAQKIGRAVTTVGAVMLAAACVIAAIATVRSA